MHYILETAQQVQTRAMMLFRAIRSLKSSFPCQFLTCRCSMQDLAGINALVSGGEPFRYAQKDILTKQLGEIRLSLQTVSAPFC